MRVANDLGMTLFFKLISTAGQIASPFVSYEIIGAMGVAGAFAHHFANRALRKTRPGHPEEA